VVAELIEEHGHFGQGSQRVVEVGASVGLGQALQHDGAKVAER
jgi:hypothetical protein